MAKKVVLAGACRTAIGSMLVCVVAYIKYATYFLFTAEYYSCAIQDDILPIHSSTDGPLGCFHLLVTVNDAAVNGGVHIRHVSLEIQFHCEHSYAHLLIYCPRLPSQLHKTWSCSVVSGPTKPKIPLSVPLQKKFADLWSI